MSPSLAVIILNYRRPQNIGAIVDTARAALPDAPIFVLDQADQPGLRERTDVAWDEVWFQRAQMNRGPGVRIALAAQLPFDHWLAIDDDTFLTAGQIRSLVERFRAEPDRAHGISGQRIELNGTVVDFRNAMREMDAAMSTLNLVYAFSRSQAQAAMALSDRLGFAAWDDIGPIDDFLLSCASPKPPLCHNLGAVAICETSNEPGIALWQSGGFYRQRVEIARKLMTAQAIAVFSPLVYRAEDG
jgi:hypothetical protein